MTESSTNHLPADMTHLGDVADRRRFVISDGDVVRVLRPADFTDEQWAFVVESAAAVGLELR